MNTTLKEYLADLRGMYSHGYFYMYINGDFNPRLRNMSVRDLGTFFHEYVHFIQNISTLWGIKTGIMTNNLMCDMFTATQNASEIHIPYTDFTPDPRIQLELEFYKITRGANGADRYKNWEIDVTQPIGISIKEDESQPWPIPLRQVWLNVTFQDGRTEQIQLGSTIIVESMAALCQSYIDPDAVHPDVPYNVVQILANQQYPNIAGDKKKLICLCYIALFSMNPGWQFMDMIRYAEHNTEKSGIELFDEFVNETILRVQGRRMNVIDFFDYIIDGYKQSIKGLIGVDTDYLNVILDNVRLSRNQAPLISVLNDENPIGIEHIEALINYLSVPFVYTSGGRYFYPATTTSPRGSGDIAMMVSTHRIYSFLIQRSNGVCPLVMFCDHNHNGCYTEPWTETNCTIEPALKKIGVYGKPIILD